MPPLDDSPYIDVHAMTPTRNPASEQTPLQAAAVQAASQRAASGQPPQIATQVPQPRIMEPQRSKGVFAIATLLLIPAVLFLIWALFAIGSCVLVCGLGGQQFATETFMAAGIWLVAAIAILSLTVSIKKRASKGISTGAWRWIALILIYGAIIAYSWNMLVFAVTGNPRYDGYRHEYDAQIQKSYAGMDCKTVTDYAGEIDCWKANSDEFFSGEFHSVAAAKNMCDSLNDPYNKAGCKVVRAKNQEKNDPYSHLQFCMDLNLEPRPGDQYSQEPHFYDLQNSIPFVTYGGQTKESLKAVCLEHILFDDPAYYENIYTKVGLDNQYQDKSTTIPDWEIENQRANCAGLTDARLKDICYAVSAHSAGYRQEFGGFCEKIGNTVPGLKENCIALRAEKAL